MAVTLNQLSTFLAVAREGSVSAAAAKQHVTQPSISAAVSSLSKEIGVDLTERVGRGIGLTPAGEAFRPYAADVLGLDPEGAAGGAGGGRHLDAEPQHRRGRDRGRVRRPVAPRRVRAAPSRRSSSRSRSRTARRSSTACSSTRSTSRSRAGRPTTRGSRARAFLANEIVAIGAPDRPRGRGRAGAARGARRPRLAAARARLRHARSSSASSSPSTSCSPQTLTLGSNGAIKEAVRLGLGVSLQSRRAVEQELAAGTLAEIRIRGGLPRREWYILRSATRAAPPRGRALPRLRARRRTAGARSSAVSGAPRERARRDPAPRASRRRSSRPTSRGSASR